MNRPPTPSPRRLRATFWSTLSALLPLSAIAESVVFDTDFSGSANTVGVVSSAPNNQLPSVITTAGTTWYGAFNKANGGLSVDANGLLRSGGGSTSATTQVAGRITPYASRIKLAEVGDYIEFSGTFYTGGLTNIAVGMFNSGGVDPLTARPDGVLMLNNGLTAVSGQFAVGGTSGWTGYRAMSLNASTSASFVARPAQTSSAGNNGYEVLSVGTGQYNSPAHIDVGSLVNSSSSVAWRAESTSTPYGIVYRIQRSSATAFSFTLTVTNQSTNSVVYSSSGSTSNASAQPSAITDSFDAVAVGGRVDTGSSTNPAGYSSVFLQYTDIKVTAKNSDIARITAQPTTQNLPLAGSGSISVTATGSGTLAYQWYKEGSPLSGATSATYNFTNASSGDAGQYYVVVSNAYGYETSQTVTVNVSSLTAPAITTQPLTQAVDAGTALTLVAEASGVPTPSYQWF